MSEKTQEKQSVMKSAVAMSLGTFGSRILGFVRDAVIAAQFDNTIKDAFVVAFRLPNMFRRLFGEGALAVSFIPVFIEQMTPKGDIDAEQAGLEAQNLKNSIYTILASVAITLSVLGVVFMKELMELLVSGEAFQSVAGKLELAVKMGRLMFFYLYLVTTFAFCMSVLNALKKFFIPAFAPALFNLFFIFTTLLPSRFFSYSGQQLGVAVIAGGIIQLLTVLWPLHKMGHLPKFYWNPRYKNVPRVFKNMVPGLIGMGVLQLMSVANINFASRLKEGTHSFIYFADRILELPQSLLAISLGTALLPTLSQAWVNDEKEKMKAIGQSQLSILMYLALPCALGMYFLAQPIVEVLFMRGNFSEADALATSQVVEIYAFLFLIMSFHKVTVPNFYAMKNTWVPAVTSTIGLLIHVSTAMFWLNAFGLRGLIYSMVVAAFLNLIVLMGFYHYFLGTFPYKKLFISTLWHAPSAIALGIVVYFIYDPLLVFSNLIMGTGLSRMVSLFVTIGASAIVYFFVGKLSKNPECEQILGIFKRRFIKRKRKSTL